MKDLIALFSVVATASVAVLVPLINARVESRRLVQTGRRADRDEARAVLDEAATALAAGIVGIEDVSERVEEAVKSSAPAEIPATALHTLQAARDTIHDLIRHDRRLAVRMGPSDPAVQAYSNARRASGTLLQTLEDVLEAGPASDGIGWHEVVRVLDNVRGECLAAEASFLQGATETLDTFR